MLLFKRANPVSDHVVTQDGGINRRRFMMLFKYIQYYTVYKFMYYINVLNSILVYSVSLVNGDAAVNLLQQTEEFIQFSKINCALMLIQFSRPVYTHWTLN